MTKTILNKAEENNTDFRLLQSCRKDSAHGIAKIRQINQREESETDLRWDF